MAAALPLAQTLCHGCLSADRDLSPVGEFITIFKRICYVETASEIKEINLCWECKAILKRVHSFNTQVNKAQAVLKFYVHTKDLQKSLPKSLSKLEVTKTNHDYISLTQPDELELDITFVKSSGSGFQIRISTLEEIKQEDSHYEYDPFDNTDILDAESKSLIDDAEDDEFDGESETDDVKDDEKDDLEYDPSYIVNKKSKKECTKQSKIQQKKQLNLPFCRINTADEMCVEEQARPSDLVNLWERDGCISQGSDPSNKMLSEQSSKDDNTVIQNSDDQNELKPLTCKICHARYPTLEELSSHVTSHETVYRCLVCGHWSPSMAAAGRHVTQHGEMFKCQLCEYCCVKVRDVKAHYKIAHTKFFCDYCKKKLKSKRALEKHISRLHVEYTCKVCLRTYTNYYTLNMHIARMHETKPNKGRQKKLLRNKMQLEMQYCHISTAEEMCVEEQARPSDFVNLWERDGCISPGSDPSNKMFSEQSSKDDNTAIQNSDDQNEIKPLTCKICHARYPTLEELSSHVTSHVIYRCLVCGQRSPSMAAAGRHVAQHGEMIKCRLCEYCCVKVRDVKAHYKIAHTKFFCDHCGIKLKSKHSLENHIARLHVEYKCKVCSRTYTNYYTLKLHIARMHGTKPDESLQKKLLRIKTQLEVQYCHITTAEEMCVKEQARPSDLVNLWERDGCNSQGSDPSNKTFSEQSIKDDNTAIQNSDDQNEVKPLTCKICHARYPTLEELSSHVTSHETVYRCLVCGHRSPSMAAAGRHVTQHGKIIKCRLCEYCCVKVRDVKAHHEIAHTKFLCDHCGMKLKSKHALEKHITRLHMEYTCNVCSRTYRNYYILNAHIAQKHGAKPNKSRQKKLLGNKTQLEQYCHISTAEEICVEEQARPSDFVNLWERYGCISQGSDPSNKIFSAQSSKDDKTAIQSADDQNEVKPLTCEICHARYPTLDELSSHVTSHETVFRCLVCGHRSPSMAAAGRHIIQHGKITKCRLCEYCCVNVRDVKAHYKLAHTQFFCDYCKKKLKSKRALEKHISRLHVEYTCKVCSRTYRNYYILNTHIARMHGTIPNKSRQKKLLRNNTQTEVQYCHISTAEEMCVEELSSHVTSHETVYRCLVCGHRSPSMAAAGRHVTQHGKIIKCRLCEYCCVKVRDVKAHYKIAHTKFLCDHCGKICRIKRAIENHITRHHMVNKCSECSRTFRSYYRLHAHIGIVHGRFVADKSFTKHGEVVKCQLCEYSCAKVDDVKDHYMLAHTDFFCDHCGKKHKKKSAIELHITRHHMDHTCKQCARTFGTYLNYKNHIMRVHGIRHAGETYCATCNKQFKNHFCYKYHLKNSAAHLKAPLPRKYKCDQCPKSYPLKGTLHRHIEKAHRTCETEDTFCSTCQIQFENKPRFKNHLRTRAHKVKAGLAVERFKCKQCDKSYTTQLRLTEHYDVEHLGTRKYHCRDCDKEFKASSTFKKHRLYVHEKVQRKKDKLCSVCGRGFSINKTLLDHMRTHTGERPYACAVCDARFAQKSARDVHQKRHSAQKNVISVDDDSSSSSS